MTANPVAQNFVRSTQKMVYFDNMPMYNLEVAHSRPDIDRVYDNCFKTIEYISYGYDEISLSFQLFTSGSYDHRSRLLNHIFKRYRCQKEFGILGQGWVCQNCGDYNPSGNIECFKCGGQAQKDFVKPMQFPFCFTNIQTDSLYPVMSDELLPVIVEMVGYGKECVDVILSMMNGQNIFSTNGYSLESGYYLCAYCGQAVPEGETCSGCGGKRLTFQELVQLERKCVYCGRQVYGGHVCKGCGARIRGLTFSKVFGKVM